MIGAGGSVVRRLLIRIVLALYPARVRQRYGREIADLLAASDRLRRDLMDVAWCALGDRIGSAWNAVRLSAAVIRGHGGRLLELFAAPLLFWVVLLVLNPVSFIAAGMLASVFGGGSFHTDEEVGIQVGLNDAWSAVPLVAAPLVAVPAVWKAWRLGNHFRMPGPALIVPIMVVAGSVAVTSPMMVLMFADEPVSVALGPPVAAVCWWLVVLPSGTVGMRLIRQGRPVAAGRLMAGGGLVALAVAHVVYLGMHPYGWSGAASDLVFGSLPQVLTVATPFVLTLLAAIARQPEPGDPGRLLAPGR